MAHRWHDFRHNLQRIFMLATVVVMTACNRTPPLPSAADASAPTATASSPTATTPSLLPTITPATTPTFAAGALTPTTNGPASDTTTAGTAAAGTIFTSPRFSYTVVLPCCWLALPTPGTAMESALADLEAEEGIPLWGDLSDNLRAHENGAVLELLALLPDAENLAVPIAQATVSVLPTYGLTLEQYADATQDELARIANTSVQSTRIDPALGVGGFPAAVIEYRASPPTANGDSTKQTIAGLQIAFFGEDATSLIVLTFTTTVERFDTLQPEFMHIVRTVTLQDSTT